MQTPPRLCTCCLTSRRELSCLVQVLSVLPLAAVHTLGNLLTNVSLGQVAVSFTHTIKASACCYDSWCFHAYNLLPRHFQTCLPAVRAACWMS